MPDASTSIEYSEDERLLAIALAECFTDVEMRIADYSFYAAYRSEEMTVEQVEAAFRHVFPLVAGKRREMAGSSNPGAGSEQQSQQ
ncbi:uncharacterized protein N7483_009774 [Penicillium malachiteum]|uniref:uncharacterized protein n=1 Tax=Penicillium malachiteum TaxID=1324776 RepID=UPI002547DCE7|nr:uncharacterized protein N7483_009774 [Penicillium malachiteum]KAJ5721840.1 hypothetical protein N7483_009774 [Penicillium malachiteum]